MAAKIRSSRSSWARRSCTARTYGTSRKSMPRSTSRTAPKRWATGRRSRRAPAPGPRTGAGARVRAAAGGGPVFLGRGSAGPLGGPARAAPARHGAPDVGEEPLLLARTAPTIVARDRVKGAAIAAGASVIVMDDGFHNPSL